MPVECPKPKPGEYLLVVTQQQMDCAAAANERISSMNVWYDDLQQRVGGHTEAPAP